MKKPFDLAHSKGLVLKGIWHFAMVLKDNFLVAMNEEQFRGGFAAKVTGAYNLHQLTLDYPHLDFFVMMSSVCGILGNLEQSNYAAACTYLDSLATYRQNLGLKGLAVQLGGTRGAGLLERSRAIFRISKQRGFETLHVSEMLSMIHMFIQNQEQGML